MRRSVFGCFDNVRFTRKSILHDFLLERIAIQQYQSRQFHAVYISSAYSSRPYSAFLPIFQSFFHLHRNSRISVILSTHHASIDFLSIFVIGIKPATDDMGIDFFTAFQRHPLFSKLFFSLSFFCNPLIVLLGSGSGISPTFLLAFSQISSIFFF